MCGPCTCKQVASLEKTSRASKEEAANAMQAERKAAQQLERANEQADNLKAQVTRAESALAQSQAQLQLQKQVSSSRHQHRPALELTTEEDAAADAAAFAATMAPAGSLRLTVCVPNLQRLTRSSSSESLMALAAVAPETALAMGSKDKPKERPRRLLYVCDGSLPVSWLLSMVLRDCDERADLVGLRRPKSTLTKTATPATAAAAVSQLENDNGSVLPGGTNSGSSADSLPSGGRMLDLAADLREVAKDGDVLEAVLDENTSQLLRERQERRQQSQQMGASSSAGGGHVTEPTELLFAKGGLATKPKPSGHASGKEAVVPTAEAFRVQRSVLANWINYKVAPRKCFVGHLFKDLSDGLLLKHLLEVITGEDIEEWAKHHDNPSALSASRQQQTHLHKSQSPRGFYAPGMTFSSTSNHPSGNSSEEHHHQHQQQQQHAADNNKHHSGRRPHILGKELSKRLMGGGFSDTTAIPNNPRAYAPGSTPDQVLGNRKVYQQLQQGNDGGGVQLELGPKEKLHNVEVLFRFMVARHVLPPPPPLSVAGAMMDEDEDDIYAEDEVYYMSAMQLRFIKKIFRDAFSKKASAPLLQFTVFITYLC